MLDVVVVHLPEAEQYEELGSGTLYIQLQRKLPEDMLIANHHWIFEKERTESVETLQEWILLQAEFQVITNERRNTCISMTFPIAV